MRTEIRPLLLKAIYEAEDVEMEANKVIYPVLIKKFGKDFLVYIPDLDIKTEGENEFDAIRMARDAISLMVMELQDGREQVPEPSDAEKAVSKAKADADEDLDFSDGLLTFVDADIAAYRQKYGNRYIRKNCTIPYWMSQEADSLGINYSRVLQDALEKIIGKRETVNG